MQEFLALGRVAVAGGLVAGAGARLALVLGPASRMAAKLAPMQLRAATQRRNSYITVKGCVWLAGGVYYYDAGDVWCAIHWLSCSCVLCDSLRAPT